MTDRRPSARSHLHMAAGGVEGFGKPTGLILLLWLILDSSFLACIGLDLTEASRQGHLRATTVARGIVGL